MKKMLMLIAAVTFLAGCGNVDNTSSKGGPIKIKGLAHVCFAVKDLAASEAFYRDVLGFETAFDFVNDEGKRFGAYMWIADRNFIELFENKGQHAGPGLGYQHLCLEVDDIEEMVTQLRQKGIKVSDPKFADADRSYQAWLADNEGNRIELHQYTPQSKQVLALRKGK